MSSMGFRDWKITLKERQPRRPSSAMMFTPEETPAPETRGSTSQLDETISIFRKLKRTNSTKGLVLPQIPHLRPITMNNLLADPLVANAVEDGMSQASG